MAGNKTFSIIKPVAVKNNHIGHILAIINEDNFIIRGMRMTNLTKEQAEEFYSVHKGKPFFDNLVSFMTSGPIVLLYLEKENAVDEYRKLIGATDPEKAADGTIRKLYGTSLTANAVHGSDCDENAEIELNFFFSPDQVFFY